MTPEQKPLTAVLGLGNVLMGDDAFGPTLIQTLWAHYDFPDGIRVEDLGTPGLDLHPFVDGTEALVLVDTVRASGQAGEIRTYRTEEILRHAPGTRTSPHDPGVKEALLGLQFAGRAPEQVLLVGVIPERVGSGVGLSDPVRRAIPRAAATVIAELQRLGYEVPTARFPRRPEFWWAEEPKGEVAEMP